MAHIAKYKAASCGHMLAHYRRDASSLGRENIDPTRTKGNYTLGLDDRDGKERTGLRETLRNWNPSLPMFAGSRVRDALNAAQSSIQSLLDAQERREQLERQLRSLETESGR